MTLILTMQQIKDLAEFTGMVVDATGFDSSYMEGKYAITDCPPEGVKNDGEPGDPDSVSHYDYLVYCVECPEDGCIGLGPEVAPQPQDSALERYQPCGCVLCICDDESQCHGCGATMCGTHPHPEYVREQPQDSAR